MKPCRRIDSIFLVLTAFLLVNKIVCEGPKLSISPQHAVQYFEANKPSGLMCAGAADDDAAEGAAFTEMKWLDPQGGIIPEGNPGVKQMGPNILKLTFETPSVRDSGHYNCTALYRNTQSLEASTFVTFYEGISWEECETEQSLIRDREGKISCKPTGNPTPKINWEKDGQSIISDRISVTAEGIVISNVRDEDEGQYQVEAFVPETGSNERRNIRVSVFIPPRIIRLDEEFKAIEGEQYIIPCEAEGFPNPKYYWYDPKMRDLTQEEGFLVNEETGTLTINSVKGEHRGNYTCEARNSAGTDTQYMTLTVLVKPVIRQFDNVTVKEGDDAILVCETYGEPKPDVKIRKDNSIYSFGENEDGRITLQTSMANGAKILSLNAKQVKRSDGGLYYCSAENGAGRVDRVGHIEVLFAPNMSRTETTTVKTWASNPVNLTCIAEANPNATISWMFKNERIVDNNNNNQIYQIYGGTSFSNLLVKIGENPSEHDIFGVYKCEAQNSIGKASVDILLELATTPDMLSQVVFEEVKPTTITFKLLGPSDTGGLPLLGYVVRYWNNTNAANPLTHEWPMSKSYVLTNMKPRTKYTFMFAAKNAVGVGPERHAEYNMPTEQYPDTPVFRNKDESVSDYSDKFELKWNIPNDNGATIRYFHIRYFKVERSIAGWKDISQQASEAQIDYEESMDNPAYELTNLSPNTWYKVELRANNRLGNSYPGYLVFRTRASHGSEEHTSMVDDGPLTLPVIIAIVVVAVLAMLILLDITCYLRFHCGLLYLMRYHTCGRSSSAKKVKNVHMEDGRDCVKEISTADNGKIKSEIKLPSPKALSPSNASDKPFNHTDDKPRMDGVYPAYDGRRDAIRRSGDGRYPFESAPMMETRN